MDAATPKSAQTADTHLHLVRPQEMEWQKTRFPGSERLIRGRGREIGPQMPASAAVAHALPQDVSRSEIHEGGEN